MTTVNVSAELRAIEATLGGGMLGVCAVNDADVSVEYNEDVVFPLASVVKAVIVAELFAQAEAGRLSVSDTVTLSEGDKVAGSGVLASLSAGHTFTLAELAYLAIAVSDNSASNAVLRAVGGVDVINARLYDEWNMPDTVLHRPIKFHLSPGDAPHTATGEPRDMAFFMNAIAHGELHSEAVSRSVAHLLQQCDDTAMLPRFLEVNAFAGDLDTAAAPLTVFHKPGAVTGVRNDAGFIRRGDASGHVAMAIYTKNVPDTRWTVANAGCEAVAEVARLITRQLLPE
ncbi:MAG: serine hydrolase [Armatimonadetes bacterium]|nr:serine hydrolase [Armatimonadota bacterium]